MDSPVDVVALTDLYGPEERGHRAGRGNRGADARIWSPVRAERDALPGRVVARYDPQARAERPDTPVDLLDEVIDRVGVHDPPREQSHDHRREAAVALAAQHRRRQPGRAEHELRPAGRTIRAHQIGNGTDGAFGHLLRGDARRTERADERTSRRSEHALGVPDAQTALILERLQGADYPRRANDATTTQDEPDLHSNAQPLRSRRVPPMTSCKRTNALLRPGRSSRRRRPRSRRVAASRRRRPARSAARPSRAIPPRHRSARSPSPGQGR